MTPGVEGAWTIYDSSNVGYGLTRTDYKNVIGSFASTVSGVKLVTESEEIPQVWNAVLPISIVVQ
ncbi:hypothetical protein JCM19233_5527 [Vibrio astriarenae]|nr:hypothetical protein JCM19233_5527 [Vibrio sp. C7]